MVRRNSKRSIKMLVKLAVTAAIVVAIVFGILSLFVWLAMLLWNGCLVGAVVGVVKVGFWQTWGLIILSGVLFKSGGVSIVSKVRSRFGK
jgi:uncharacterized membrane protein SpoIIM required for sporulation